MLRRLTQQWVSQTPLVTGSPSVARRGAPAGPWCLRSGAERREWAQQPALLQPLRKDQLQARVKELDGPTLRQAGAVSLPFPTVAPGPLGVAAVGPLPPAPAASGRAGRAAAVFRPSPDVAEAVWELRSESAVWVSVDTCNCN